MANMPGAFKPFYLAIIPARSGSKRVPGKNTRLLGGIPLIAHTIKAAADSRKLGRTVVSTDSKRIAKTAREWGGDVPFLRPPEIARDTSPAIETIVHAIRTIEQADQRIDAVVLLQPTSPFRTGAHIDAALDLFEASKADTVTSVRELSEHPYWCWTIKNGDFQPYFSKDHMSMGRESLPPAFIENGAVFVIRESVIAKKAIYGERIVPYLMSRESSLDIDTLDDLRLAEFLLEKRVR
jgi:CMP-N-acetylneuraminic acid synthetase